MDDPALDPRLHRAALTGLGRINRVSRSAGILWPAIQRAVTQQIQRGQRGPHRPARVLDLACGGGDVLIELRNRARAAGLPIAWTGLDTSAVAIDFARQRDAAAAGDDAEMTWVCGDVFGPWPEGGFDVAMNSLFMHHLDADQAVAVLRKMAAAGSTVLINDLRRGAVAYTASVVGTRLLSRSPIVHVDGPRSVRAAWSPQEMSRLAEEAGLAAPRVEKRFPWRMLLEWSAPDHATAATGDDSAEAQTVGQQDPPEVKGAAR